MVIPLVVASCRTQVTILQSCLGSVKKGRPFLHVYEQPLIASETYIFQSLLSSLEVYNIPSCSSAFTGVTVHVVTRVNTHENELLPPSQ